MKHIFAIFSILIFSANVFAQSPNKMSYQAVIRNSSNLLVANQKVGMRISILKDSAGGTEVYVETQNPTTNINGLASVEIGGGILVSGSLSSIDWSKGRYFVKTETDPLGGVNYTITGTSQLLSVPYALYAETSGSLVNKVAFQVNGSGANQNIAGSNTMLSWTSETFDLGNNFTNNKFIAPVDGVYQFDAAVDIVFSANNQMILLGIYKNGTIVNFTKQQSTGVNNRSGTVSALISLKAKDEVQLGVMLISGSNIKVDGSGKDGTYFTGHLVY
jgi:hypothetical protein